VSYVTARVLRARGLIMSIFEKRFPMCYVFCALLMTSLILGELWEPKIGPFVLFFFSLNVMQKFRAREIKFRGNSDTDKK